MVLDVLGHARVVAGGDAGRRFDLDGEGVHGALAPDHELVVGLDVGTPDEHRLDLRGEHVDAPDDQHVVGAPGDAHDARVRAPADARLIDDPRDVAGAVAQHGLRPLGQGRDDQLAGLAHGQALAAIGVYGLEQEAVFPGVQAVARLDALAGDAGADDFRQAVDVDRLDPQALVDLGAQGVGPRLGAVDADLEGQRAHVDAHLLADLGDVQRVGRRAADDARPEVLEQHDLAFGQAAGQRQHGHAQTLRPVVEAEAAGEQAVAVGVVQDVAGARPGGGHAARHQIGPHVEVLARVADDGGLAGGARRGMEAHHLVARHGEHAERVGGAQVVLHGEGEAGEVVEALEVAGLDAGGVEAFAVEGHVVVGVPDDLPELGELQLGELFASHGLDVGREHVGVAVPAVHGRGSFTVGVTDELS